MRRTGLEPRIATPHGRRHAQVEYSTTKSTIQSHATVPNHHMRPLRQVPRIDAGDEQVGGRELLPGLDQARHQNTD